MVDTGTVLPASVCAKADKYSFSDFLPRVIELLHVQGTQYAMPFNTSGPVLYYNKKAFTAAGLDPEQAAGDARRGARRGREAQGQRACRRPASGSRSSPRFFEHWTAMAEQALREQQQRAQGACDQVGVQLRDRAPGLQLDVGHGEGRPRRTNSDIGTGSFDDLLGIRSGSHAMAIDTQRRARHGRPRSSAPATTRTSSSVCRRCPARERQGPGRRVRAGRRAVHGEQVGAGEAGRGLAVPEVPRRAREHGHLGDRHRLRADPQDARPASRRCRTTGRRTRCSRWRTTSCSAGADTSPASGSVIGPNIEVRADAVRDAENSMFLEGADPKTAIWRRPARRPRRDQGLQHPHRRLTPPAARHRPCCGRQQRRRGVEHAVVAESADGEALGRLGSRDGGADGRAGDGHVPFRRRARRTARRARWRR